jgi:antitoxin VapB
MAIYITNPEAEELARELAAQTGETITDVVIAALRDRRDRLREPSRDERLQRLRAITEQSAAIIAGRRVDFDDLYDEFGVPK